MIEKLQGFTNFVSFYSYVINPDNIDLLRCPSCNSKVSIAFRRSLDMRYYGKAEIICLNGECEFSKNKIVVEGG